MKKGFSLIEILVVISVFAVIGLVTSQSVLTTLRGARKADSNLLVRQNIDFALSIMERQLRNAQSAECISATQIDFVDADGNDQEFTKTGNYLAFSGSRLTNVDVSITSASFVCTPGAGSGSDNIDITVVGADTLNSGAESAQITGTLSLTLRSSN